MRLWDRFQKLALGFNNRRGVGEFFVFRDVEVFKKDPVSWS
jgi:hypothetical protein